MGASQLDHVIWKLKQEGFPATDKNIAKVWKEYLEEKLKHFKRQNRADDVAMIKIELKELKEMMLNG